MKLSTLLLSTFAAIAPAVGAKDAGSIHLTFHNVASSEGYLMISLCTEEEHLEGDYGACTRSVRQPASEPELALHAIPAGAYAISVFHDVDSDGELKTNFIGIPREPLGASNDARGRFGPPSFEDMKFTVGDSPVALEITLYSL